MIQAEREITIPRTRNFVELTRFPEIEKASLVVCTDVEGPLYLGDFINDAMAQRVKPENGIDASPSYGETIYAKTWDWFTQTTATSRGISDYKNSSVSQEGEDTLFTMPLLLAMGVTEKYLDAIALKSKPTPGSWELINELNPRNVFFVGATTAPQGPIRKLVQSTGLLDPRQIIGSPFPLEELRRTLDEAGLLEKEMRTVNEYLEDCFEIIDSHSDIKITKDLTTRLFSNQGEIVLSARIKQFHDEQLGIRYESGRRQVPRNLSISGQMIEATRTVGDRGKAAIAKQLGMQMRAPDCLLVTQGDGLNDRLMLNNNFSIGLNGADAAIAAKIGIVTDDVRNELPIYEALLSEERDVDRIVEYAQARVGTKAIIHRGGLGTDPAILDEHRKMKKHLRGNIIY